MAPPLKLKLYQERALAALDKFLEVAATQPHIVAYAEACKVGEPGQYQGVYTPFDGLPATPWCCLRLPTGGGKTLLASHAIGIAHKRTVHDARYPVALWLVPTTTIADQTLKALQTPGHPYLAALEKAFGEAVRAISIDDRRALKPQDLATGATVIVSTVQSFRVTNAAGRKVYKDDEEYEGFFKGRTLPAGLMRNTDDATSRQGEVSWSFANLMAMARPVMIVDEAHNFTSDLSAETLSRLRPQSIIEFTATPLASNVISSATAAELKAEQMIKLPIHLVQHPDWQTTIVHAMQRREGLAELARDAHEPLRPIALYQAAANRDGAEGTVEEVKGLLKQHGAVDEEIAIATGTQRELDGIDLFDAACRIKHIITIEALREGWDCSFAYVFASVSNIRSATAVEQLLGRVLRMPFAERRPTEALNHAYAFAVETGFHDAAKALRDRLVAMGFDEQAARDAIVADRAAAAAVGLPDLEPGPAIPPIRTPTLPDFSLFTTEMRAAVTVREYALGYLIELADDADDQALTAITQAVAAVPGAEDAGPAVAAYIERRSDRLAPSERGEVMTVPSMTIGAGDQAELVWPETLLDLAGWTLNGVDPDLPGFVLHDQPDALVFDVANGQIQFRKDDPQLDFALGAVGPMDEASLSRWLDAHTRQIDAPPTIYLEYCRRVVTHLVHQRGFDLAALIRGKQALKVAIEQRVKSLRAAAGHRGVQLLLTDVTPSLGLGEKAFRFEQGKYNPPRLYSGGWKPVKHFYPRTGHFDGDEELACAQALDDAQGIKHWVRNVPRIDGAYWLPTSTDRFYPDFVAELNDGGWLIVEYKGAHLAGGDDTAEKANIGSRLAEVSGGQVRFWMAERSKAPDFHTRLAAILAD